ncbi:multicopper oxidase family protein [Halorubellus litoreus]|uniref:Multicopper oxidase family protein n=1 Tax=Halorubellus litoreus TaxID=755308 RepID=A0ABD5VEX8_9EURY
MSDRRKQSRYLNRRTVLKAGGAAGLAAAAPWTTGRVEAVTGDTELPVEDHKWEDPLPRPGTLTPASRKGQTDRYEIELTEFTQTVLPSSLGKTTTLWGYEGTYPAGTIEARPGRSVEVEYINNLPSDHLLSVDERVHGAGQGAPAVRTVTHLHGGVAAPEDDGYPEAWISSGGQTAGDIASVPNSEVPYKNPKEYPNDQKPGTLWYHDHALGITRLNVYAGLAGFYLLRDPMENALPSEQYEIPVLFQDRTFESNGDLFYPPGDNDEYEAEFAGDIPVVNGKVYPYLEVEPRSYRFRFLNGSNNRTFNLRFYNEDTDSYSDVPLMQQIGVDLGFLDEVVEVGPGGTVGPEGPIDSMLLSGAERADVVVDFSGYEGTTFTVKNNAEFPYAGENSGPDLDSIGEMLQIRVTDSTSNRGNDVNLDGFLNGVNGKYQEPETNPSGITRTFTLDSAVFTVESGDFEGDELDSHFLDLALWEDDDAIVNPTLGTSEVWELYNTTGDSHPIHLHLVDFEVLERESFTWDDEAGYQDAAQAFIDGETTTRPDISNYVTPSEAPTLPNPNNRFHKDTVLVNPQEVVRIRPDFTGFTGLYPWHCHILEHEDQEMMLPYEVVSPE